MCNHEGHFRECKEKNVAVASYGEAFQRCIRENRQVIVHSLFFYRS